MKLIVEIPLDGNDLDDSDFDRFIKESKKAGGVELRVMRSVSEKTPDIIREFTIGAEYFKAKLVDEPAPKPVSELDCASNCASREVKPCDCQER